MNTSPNRCLGIVKYVSLSLAIGILIEGLAWWGHVYTFQPWWLVILVLFGLWGFILGGLALVTRRCGFPVQYLPGFLLLCGGEILNHYYFHGWSFYQDGPLGNMNPIVRALLLGILSGFIIPIINGIIKRFYRT